MNAPTKLRNPFSVPRSPRSPRQALLIARNKQNQRYAKIDRFFLVLFPLLFLVFNCIYWIAYYHAEAVETEIDPNQEVH